MLMLNLDPHLSVVIPSSTGDAITSSHSTITLASHQYSSLSSTDDITETSSHFHEGTLKLLPLHCAIIIQSDITPC